MKFILTTMLFFTTQVFAKEVLVAASTTGLQNVFSKIEKPFTEKTGIKIVYVGNPEKDSALDQFKKVLDGQAEAITNTIPLDEFKKQVIEKFGDNPKIAETTTRLVGRDLMKIVVHPKLNIKSLKNSQVSELFSGKIKNWKEVGGPDQPVKPVIQAGRKGTITMFQKIMLKKDEYASHRAEVDNHKEVVGFVQKNPYAIGFLPANTKEESLVIVKTDEVIGRPINLLSIGRPSENLAQLINFIKTEGPKLGVGE